MPGAKIDRAGRVPVGFVSMESVQMYPRYSYVAIPPSRNVSTMTDEPMPGVAKGSR